MVEMLESQHAITNATANSLLLFDEIGRGTSTYDGMALAQSMMEYIHDKIGANTLFSTHYHELTALEQQLQRLQNVHVSATEKDGKVVFLHKVRQGAADKSYGVHVAQLAEMPEDIIERARVLLQQFESKDSGQEVVASFEDVPAEDGLQLSLFEEEKGNAGNKEESHSLTQAEQEVLERLEKMNIMGTSPIQAMNVLYELQQMLLSKK